MEMHVFALWVQKYAVSIQSVYENVVSVETYAFCKHMALLDRPQEQTAACLH